MNINKEVRNKIVSYILKKNVDQSLKPLPEKGEYFIEYCYELAYNPKIDNIIFVMSIKMEYFNYSINKKSYNLYAFDVKNGNLIENYQENGMCYNGFFQDLQVIEEII
jgi:hypothetical protein